MSDECYEQPKQSTRQYDAARTVQYPKFLQVDKRIAETTSEIEALKNLLKSKENYLKQLQSVRKTVTPEDEAKIQALISCELL